MNLNEWRDRCYEGSVANGWHEEPRSFGDLIALAHSELSEALEEFRAGHDPSNFYYGKPISEGGLPKPLGVPSELADVLIRVFDICGRYGIDIEEVVTEKLAYNATRGHRHGGKAL